jgi:hypothetical protein
VSVAASGQTNQVRAHSQARERVGKALVKKLPAGLVGVQLSGNRVRVKPGYTFVKQADGSVTVARIKGGAGGGNGAGGKWDCACVSPGTGSCDSVVANDTLSCNKGTCSSSCALVVITTRATVRIIRY